MATLRIGVDARQGRGEMNRFAKSTNDAQSAATKATGAVDAFGKQSDRSSRFVDGLKSQVLSLVTAFAGIQTVRVAIRTIAGFEETIAQLEGVTGATASELQRLSDTAREFGATTRFSAQEAGEGLLFLARAGFSTQEAISALPATLNLATVGLIDLGEAADFASNIVSQFRLAADETERVVDTLVQTANSANTDVRQLAEALKFAGPVAGALGISVEETAAALGVLGDTGIQASLAGTNLRGILTALIGPSEDAERAINSLGLTLSDVNPEVVGISGAFEEFQKAGLGAEEALAIFGRRNISAALAITNTTEKLNELTAANEESAGVAQRNADLIADTLSGSFRNLRSAVEEAFLSIGDTGFSGALRALVDVTTQTVRILSGVEGAFSEASISARLLAGALKLLGISLGIIAATKVPAVLGLLVQRLVVATRAVGAFTLSLARNPLGIVAVVAASAAAALFNFGSAAEDAAVDVNALGDSVEQTAARFGDLANEQERVAKARILGDRIKEARALESQVDELKSALADLALEAEEGGNLQDLIAIKDVEGLLPSRDIQALATVVGSEAGVRFGQFFEQTSDDFLSDADVLRSLIEFSRISGLEAGEVFVNQFLSEFELVNAPAEDVITAIRLRIEDLQSEIQKLGVTDEQINKTRAQEEAIREATASLDEFIKSIQDERELITASAQEQERITAVRKAQSIAAKAGIELTREQIQLVRDEVSVNQDLRAAIDDQAESRRRANEAREQLSAFIENLQTERDLLTLTNKERELEVALQQASNLAKERGIELTNEEIALITRLVREQQQLRETGPQATRTDSDREEERLQAEKDRAAQRLTDLELELLAAEDMRTLAFEAELAAEALRQEQRLSIAAEAREQELITAEEHRALLEALEDQHQTNLAQITEAGKNRRLAIKAAEFRSGVEIAQTGLATVATLTEAFGQSNLAQSKAFGVAQALISTAIGIARALELGFPAAIPAIAFAAATGAAQIAAIQRASKGSGGGAAAAPRGPAFESGSGGGGGDGGGGRETRQDRQEVAISVRGLDGEGFVSKAQARALIDAIQDELNDGATLVTNSS